MKRQWIGVGGRKNRVKSFFLVDKRRARTRWRGVRGDERGRVGEVGCEKNVHGVDESVHRRRRRRGVGEGLQEVASRGWSEEGGSGVKKMCTVQIRWCAPGKGG
ncbi:hypothetical protein PMAC_003197 [Pneumocystis sp. 'macacae']|nr:hypothetical protein PMAC_003197 [Pneumocystis sp. 'macacae']